MIKSMTGFGRCEKVTEEYKISVEMKAVNHRYLDLGIKMPKKFNYFESAIRNLLKHDIQRGKVDVFINYEDYRAETRSLKYNEALAAEYMEYCRKMQEQFGLENDMKVSNLARMPEVLSLEETPEDQDEVWNILSEAVSEAAKAFVESRILEGEHLKDDMVNKLDGMLVLVQEIEERSPRLVAEYRMKLTEKVQELLGNTVLDENRIAMEVTLYADKICVDEETVRLRSHIEHTKAELLSGGSVGRKLDFIAQEMNREANTILSKANDQEISDKAIILKTEIEKVREQIQNIE